MAGMRKTRMPTLGQVFVSSPLIILWGSASEEHPIEYVAGNIERLGLSAEELTSGRTSFYSLIHEEDALGFERLFSEALRAGPDEIRTEYRLARPVGESVWIEDRTLFYRDEDGRSFAYQSSLADITGRKLSEELLRRNNERLARVLEASRICVWEYDPERGIILQADGTDPLRDEDGLARSPQWSMPRELKNGLAELNEGKVQRVEYLGRSPCAKASDSWSVSRAYPVHDEFGRVKSVSGLSIDMGELHRTERRVAMQNERLKLLQSTLLAFMEETDTDRLLAHILEKSLLLARTEHGSIALLEPDEMSYRVVLGRGMMRDFEGSHCPVDTGLCGEIHRTRNKVVIKDYRTYEDRLDDPRLARCSTMIGLPLFRGEVLYGLISVLYQDVPREVDNDFLFDLELFAGSASIALENARLHGDVRRTLNERVRAVGRLNDHIRLVETISEASSLLLSQGEASGVLERALALTARAFDACKAALFRIEPLKDEEMLARLISTSAQEVPEGGSVCVLARLDGEDCFHSLFPLLQEGEVFQGSLDHVDCPERLASFDCEGTAPYLMAVPVNLHGRLWGFLALSFKEQRPSFVTDELDLLKSAAYSMAASESGWELKREEKAGNERLRKTFADVVRTMGRIVGKKDPFTIKHQERVALLASMIGRMLNLDEARCEGLRIAGLVHDVGKIEVAGEILNKPGRLSEVEFELVKTHPRSSYEILRGIDFPWPVADIALQHHERIDGTGYPQGLRGDEILLEARILAVADVVESMASHRPYRPALGLDAAMDEIRSKRGVLYDADAVDACLSLLEERPDILEL